MNKLNLLALAILFAAPSTAFAADASDTADFTAGEDAQVDVQMDVQFATAVTLTVSDVSSATSGLATAPTGAEGLLTINAGEQPIASVLGGGASLSALDKTTQGWFARSNSEGLYAQPLTVAISDAWGVASVDVDIASPDLARTGASSLQACYGTEAARDAATSADLIGATTAASQTVSSFTDGAATIGCTVGIRIAPTFEASGGVVSGTWTVVASET